MVVFASVIGLVYVAASAGARGDSRIAIWIAFVFSVLTAMLSTAGFIRFLGGEFSFLTGNFPSHSGIYLPPYLFLLISLGSIFVVIASLVSWRWIIRGEQ